MAKKCYTTVLIYITKRLRLLRFSRIHQGKVNFKLIRNNRVLYDKKHRCFLSRNPNTAITYAGSFCCLKKCPFPYSKCNECKYCDLI